MVVVQWEAITTRRRYCHRLISYIALIYWGKTCFEKNSQTFYPGPVLPPRPDCSPIFEPRPAGQPESHRLESRPGGGLFLIPLFFSIQLSVTLMLNVLNQRGGAFLLMLRKQDKMEM